MERRSEHKFLTNHTHLNGSSQPQNPNGRDRPEDRTDRWASQRLLCLDRSRM